MILKKTMKLKGKNLGKNIYNQKEILKNIDSHKSVRRQTWSTDTNKQVKEEMPLSNNHMEKCLTLLVSKKIQIK